MQQVERLIGELRQGGQHESHGEFTLDRDKAREKMRKYQLATPQAYLTELVQAAVLKGARRIDFDIDADDTRMVFDGEPFTAEDFSELYTSMFSSDTGPAIRARQQLALGLNGALGLQPRFVRLISADAGAENLHRAVAVELRPDEPDCIEQVTAEAAGTRIHVKKRLRPGLVIEFIRNLAGTASEELRLKEHCGYCPVPVLIEGKQVSVGLQLPDALLTVDIREEAEGQTGIAGFTLDQSSGSVLHILTNGVLVTSQKLDLGPPPFIAVVDGRRLQKNVAQTGIVRDAAYDQLQTTVLAARERAMAELCQQQLAPARPLRAVEDKILLMLRHEILQFTELAALMTDADRYPGIMAGIALWPTAADTERLLSLHDLVGLVQEQGQLRCCTRSFHHFSFSQDLQEVLLLPDKAERDHLDRLLGGKVKNVTRSLINQIKREQNRKRWQTRKHDASLGGGSYLARAAVQAEGVRGEVGLADADRSTTAFRLVKQGHLLHRTEVETPVPGCEVVLEAAFASTKNFDNVRKDRTAAAALLAVVRVLPQLVEEVAAGFGQPRRFRHHPPPATFFRQVIGFFADPDFPSRYLVAFGFREGSAARHVQRESKERTFVLPDLSRHSRSPLLSIPCFSTTGRQPVSLADLYQELAHNRRVAYVTQMPASPPADRPAGRTLLLGDEKLRATLQQLLGAQALYDAGDDLQRSSGRARHQLKPPQEPRLGEHHLAALPVQNEGMRGEVAFLDPTEHDWTGQDGGPDPQQALVELLLEERPLARRLLPVPVGPLWAVVDCDDLVPTPAWDDVEEGEPLRRVLRTITDALPDLLGLLAVSLARLEPDQGHVAHDTMLAAFERLTLPAADDQAGGRIVERLRQLPLFPALGRPWVSLARLQDLAAERGQVPFITPNHGERVAELPYLVVVCDERRQRLLARLLGAERLADSTARLREVERERQLSSRPRLATVALAEDEALLSVPLQGEGITGAVGLLPRQPTIQRPSTVLKLCTNRRLVTTLRLASDLALVALVDDPQLQLSDDGSPSSETLSRALEPVSQQVGELLRLLTRRWPALDPAQRQVAWWHALTALARGSVLPEGDGTVFTASLDAQVRQALSALPGLRGADGRSYSLNDLEQSFNILSEVRTLRVAVPGSFDHPQHLVIVVSAWEREYLERLFAKVVDYGPQWYQRRLSRLPAQPPGEAAAVSAAPGAPVVPPVAASRPERPFRPPLSPGTEHGTDQDKPDEAEPVLLRPDPEKLLLELVRIDLRRSRQEDSALGADDIEQLHLGDGDRDLVASNTPQGPLLHRRNRLVTAALELLEHDPIPVRFLSAAVFTAVNIARPDITDKEERLFLLKLTETIADDLLPPARAGEQPAGPT